MSDYKQTHTETTVYIQQNAWIYVYYWAERKVNWQKNK